MWDREVSYTEMILVSIWQEFNPCNKNILHCFILYSFFFFSSFLVFGLFFNFFPSNSLFRFSVVEGGFRSWRTPDDFRDRMGNSSFLQIRNAWNGD